MPRYFNIAYTGKDETTVNAYIKSSESKVWNMTEAEFLSFSDDEGVSNLEKIYAAYDELQKLEWKNDYMLGRLQIIVSNTNMSLPQGNTDPRY
jgi:hypothetical protein